MIKPVSISLTIMKVGKYERKMFAENEHPAFGKYKTINQPLKFKNSDFNNNSNAPVLGADTEAILKELVYTEEKQADLRIKKIIK